MSGAARRGKGPGGDSRTARLAERASERASEQGVPKTCNYGPGVHQAMPPPPPVASRRSRPTSSVSLFISVSFLRLSPTLLSRFSIVSVLSPLALHPYRAVSPLAIRFFMKIYLLYIMVYLYFEIIGPDKNNN